jgi:hypothetical protein
VETFGYQVTFRDANARDQAHKYLPQMAHAGLSPELIELTDAWVRTLYGVPLNEWKQSATREALAAMRPLVRELINGMHALGICHRDLHDRNVVIGPGDVPLAIDMEHACDAHPRGPCYDLVGPSSGIPVPLHHARQGGVIAEGIWWGSGDPGGGLTPLGRVFDSDG